MFPAIPTSSLTTSVQKIEMDPCFCDVFWCQVAILPLETQVNKVNQSHRSLFAPTNIDIQRGLLSSWLVDNFAWFVDTDFPKSPVSPQIISTFWVIVVQKEQSVFTCDLRQVAGRQVDSQSLRPHVFLNTEIFTSCLASPTVCRNLVVLDSKKYPTAGLRGQRLENPFLRVEKPWRRWFLFERKVGMIFLFVHESDPPKTRKTCQSFVFVRGRSCGFL